MMSNLVVLQQKNPAEHRRTVQTNYDEYMRGERLELGMWITGLGEAFDATTVEERNAAYENVVQQWAKKTQPVMRALAREVVFEQLSRDHHNNAQPFLEEIDRATHHAELSTPHVYVSGLGRNACLATTVLHGEMRRYVGTHTGIQASINLTASRAPELRAGLIIVDPDFGLGNIQGPTPEVFASELGGHDDLSPQGMQGIVDVMRHLRGEAA